MEYIVIITQDGEKAFLHCKTFQEAIDVRRSFINYGKCQSVIIQENEK